MTLSYTLWKHEMIRAMDKAGPVFRDADRYWVGGGFLYHHPDDPAVFVPKRYSLGYTVNWGHPLGKLFMIGLVLMALLKARSQH